MADFKSVTSPKLQELLLKFSTDIEWDVYNLARSMFFLQELPPETWGDIDLLVNGARTFVRVLLGQDSNGDGINGQSFFNQDNTLDGLKGQKFWQILGGNFTKGEKSIIVFNFQPTALFTNVPIFGNLITIANGLTAYYAQIRANKLKQTLPIYINTFKEFLTEWEKEDRLQNPEKYLKIDPTKPNQTPATFTAKANQDGTITVQGITNGDIVSIDGVAQIAATSNIFTTTAQKDGEHKVTVYGAGLYSYAETVNVTTKVALLSAPLTFIQNNPKTVVFVVLLLIGLYVAWKRGVFTRT